jgi:uncharacterized protein YdhG (YjbR/CyaY superfamily)
MRPKTISEYIAAQPKEARAKLREMRSLVLAAAPRAKQGLKWNMPAFSYDRILVMFAGFKRHVGFFPTPSAILAFKKDLTGYKFSRATIQFPLDQPLPKALIRRITKFRVMESKLLDKKWMETD